MPDFDDLFQFSVLICVIGALILSPFLEIVIEVFR